MVEEICPKCGLPKSLCVCEVIEREAERIKLFVEKRTFGKLVTIVDGISDEEKAEEILSRLKKKLGCGGTFKNNRIELQGDHRKRVREILLKDFGYKEEQVELS